MKKIFSQMWQWIIKNKKKLIYGALVLFIGQICFFSLWWIWVENQVFAADATNNAGSVTEKEDFVKKVSQWGETFSYFKSIIYVVMYPILIMVGKFVDNSMVYGSIFWFDAVLWRLWVIVRNLANYGLWFLFLFRVFEYLIWKVKEKDFKKDILVPALIAWVWINASWFIMAALLDVSTIATYGVWWLPIKMLGSEDDSGKNADGSDKQEYNPYVWPTIVVYDATDPTTVKRFLFTGNVYISECEIFTYENGGKKEDLLLAPKYIYYNTGWNSCQQTKNFVCHYDNQVYYFNSVLSRDDELQSDWEKVWENKANKTIKDCKDAQNSYSSKLGNIKNNIKNNIKGENFEEFIRAWNILQIWDAHTPGWIKWNIFTIAYATGQDWWQDVDNKRSANEYWLNRLKETIDNSWFVWVFSSLYSSLMEAWWDLKVSGATYDWAYVSLLNIALWLWHMLAVSIPLIAMMIVFILRIWVLWMAITLSPFIVLLTAFKLDKVMEKVDFLKYLKIWNLIPIIFSPVVMCFAVSLSTVLVRIITTLNWQKIDTEPSILWWIVTIDIAWIWANIWKMIVSIMWIAITRFLVWAAVRSSKLGEIAFVKNLKDLAETTIWSIPIVPIPWKDWQLTTVGANTAFWLNGKDDIVSTMMNRVKSEYNKQDTDAVEALLGLDKGKRNQAIAEDYIKASWWIDQIVSQTDDKWRTNPVSITAYGLGNMAYNQLDPEVRKIIDERIESEKKGKKDEKKNDTEKEEKPNESST